MQWFRRYKSHVSDSSNTDAVYFVLFSGVLIGVVTAACNSFGVPPDDAFALQRVPQGVVFFLDSCLSSFARIYTPSFAQVVFLAGVNHFDISLSTLSCNHCILGSTLLWIVAVHFL